MTMGMKQPSVNKPVAFKELISGKPPLFFVKR